MDFFGFVSITILFVVAGAGGGEAVPRFELDENETRGALTLVGFEGAGRDANSAEVGVGIDEDGELLIVEDDEEEDDGSELSSLLLLLLLLLEKIPARKGAAEVCALS